MMLVRGEMDALLQQHNVQLKHLEKKKDGTATRKKSILTMLMFGSVRKKEHMNADLAHQLGWMR